MLIYLPADVPFLLFPTFQKLWFQPSLSSSYFIRGVRLWADKKLTFSLINSPEPLTSRNQSQVLSFPSFSIIRSSFFEGKKDWEKISIRSRIIKFYVSIKRRRWKAILIYIYIDSFNQYYQSFSGRNFLGTVFLININRLSLINHSVTFSLSRKKSK